ncbi:MAG: hypothetical protein AAF493_19520 [Pseudomonadota bacterium]
MIAPEGRVLVGVSVAASVIATAWAGWWPASPLWLVSGGLARLFYEPVRGVSGVGSHVTGAVDGTVVAVEAADDPWYERPALRIGVELRFPGIAPLRAPIDGRVDEFWTELKHEAFLASPTCYTLGLVTDREERVTVAVSSRHRHSRYRSNVSPGERVGKGIRTGFVYLADRLDLYLPPGAQPNVQTGDRCRANSTVLADLASGQGS